MERTDKERAHLMKLLQDSQKESLAACHADDLVEYRAVADDITINFQHARRTHPSRCGHSA